jgi:predicted MFS family arabinose efflux permease
MATGEPGRAHPAATEAHPAAPTITRALTVLLAVACGAIAANLYYAQPLIALIAPSVGLGTVAASLVVTLTQIGYGVGLILLVPLADMIENRRLVIVTLSGTVVALAIAAVAPGAGLFLFAALLIGISSVAAQILIPMAAHMSPDAIRGRVVGNVMSGLLIGILLARPIAGVVADVAGWRAIFFLSALMMVGLLLVLAWRLPKWQPAPGPRYGQVLRSLATLFRRNPLLRRRSAYQAAMFAAFSLFWTAVPLELASPRFGYSQSGIALFALVGAAGALAAPLAGRVADRGWTRPATGGALASVALAFAMAWAGGAAGSVVVLAAAGILLDFGVQANMVLGQRTIYALAPEARGRLNGIYVASAFAGGAVGSAIASGTFGQGGWSLVTLIGLGFPVAALLFYSTELLRRRAAPRCA